MSDQQTKRHQLLVTLFEAFNRHDSTGVMACMTDDVVFDTVVGPEMFGSRIVGTADVKAAFEKVWAGIARRELDLHVAQCVWRSRVYPSGFSAARLPMARGSRPRAAIYSRSAGTSSRARVRSVKIVRRSPPRLRHNGDRQDVDRSL